MVQTFTVAAPVLLPIMSFGIVILYLALRSGPLTPARATNRIESGRSA